MANKNRLKENSFEGGVSGTAGSLNYQTPYGTPFGGNTSQNRSKFSSNDKSVNHMDNEPSQSMVSNRSDRKSSSGALISPAVMSDKGGFENSDQPGDSDESPNTIEFNGTSKLPDENSSTLDPDTADNSQEDIDVDNKPIDPDKGLDKEVDKLFTKKITPSPDEILSALQYEMNQMVKKDKFIAKQNVLKNLKTDPQYYSRLLMLNIDDEKMKVDENTTFNKTKRLLDKMVAEKKQNIGPVAKSKEINEIFKDLWNKRHGFKKR